MFKQVKHTASLLTSHSSHVIFAVEINYGAIICAADIRFMLCSDV